MGKVSPDRIQRFRTEFGYTQEDLAELCGVFLGGKPGNGRPQQRTP